MKTAPPHDQERAQRAAAQTAPAPTDAGDGRRPGFSLTIDPSRVLKLGLVLVVLFDLASIAGVVMQQGLGLDGEIVDSYVQITNVNRESSVPTWFQSSLLLACAAFLWTVGAACRRAGFPRPSAWRLLAAAFLYLSIDEAVALHEGFNRPVRNALNLDGALYFSWVVAAVPVVLVFGLMLLPWLRGLPGRTRLAFLGSGAVYISGSVGMELVGSVLWRSGGRDTVAYAVASTLEETMEMVGVLLFVAAVGTYYYRHVVGAAEAAGAGTAPVRAEA